MVLTQSTIVVGTAKKGKKKGKGKKSSKSSKKKKNKSLAPAGDDDISFE